MIKDGGDNLKNNKMELSFLAISSNEAFARVAVAAFFTQLNPTLAEITEVKTAVSEAVTNAIIHGYEMEKERIVNIACTIEGREGVVVIKDSGVGICDIEKAREPLFTTKPDMERSGMGFTIMEEFMDYISIESSPEKGTTIVLKKNFTE